jgi:hypothetical protein
VKILARNRTRIDKNRVAFGKIRKTNKKIRTVAATNKIKATIERPDDAVEQPEQYKPKSNVHLGVANAIIQKSADIAVTTAVIISRIVSLIGIVSTLVLFLTVNPTDVNDGKE